MGTILVTSDLSDDSVVAFPVASRLANALGCEVALLAVVEDPAQVALVSVLEYPVFFGPDIRKEVLERVTTDANALAEKYFKDLNCSVHVKEEASPVHRAIVESAEELKAELIVMATHGRTGVKRALMGSVAERVVREASCPVVLVPSTASKD